MRKELKSKSRRKWLLGGSLAFASVALLTTGFATWVIGTRQTSGDGQLNIGVDTAQDNSVELTFSLAEDKIFVAENAGSTNSNLTIERKEADTESKPDWDIKIKDLNIVVGETFYNSIKDKQGLKIVFELQKDVTEDIKSATNSVTDDMVGVRGGQTGSSWNYIKLAKNEFDVNLPKSYPAGGKIYDINDTPDNKTFSFTWGSYFGEKVPSEFYKLHEPKEGLRGYYQNALKELQAMKTDLTGELKLTATFNYGQTVGE